MIETAVEAESNSKRLQRSFRHFQMDFESLACLIAQGLFKEPWGLGLDRSLWQIGPTPVNVLMRAVIYKGIAIALLWRVMAKTGNSNTDERIVLRERFLQLFGWQAVAYLTADREFCGREWLAYLKRSRIPFRLLIPNNTQVSNRHRNQRLAVTRLFPLKVGEVMVTSQNHLGNFSFLRRCANC